MKDPRSSRQSFLGPTSESVVRGTRVAIIGLGGGGSHIVQQLAHVGVGHFDLFDPDHFEDTNINRLVGAMLEGDTKARTAKVKIAERAIHAINPLAQVTKHGYDWRTGAEYIRRCDVVFGCVDSFINRSEIEVMCQRYLIPYIDIGMDVFEVGDRFSISGQVIVSMPGELCMRCMGFLRADLLAKEAANYGAAGGRPQVVWPNGVLASTAVGLFMEFITPWHNSTRGPVFLEYDGNSHTVSQSNILKHLNEKKCIHFQGHAALGDPFFNLNSSSTTEADSRSSSI